MRESFSTIFLRGILMPIEKIILFLRRLFIDVMEHIYGKILVPILAIWLFWYLISKFFN